jgi:hypothetical protein
MPRKIKKSKVRKIKGQKSKVRPLTDEDFADSWLKVAQPVELAGGPIEKWQLTSGQ